eukprot:TRINITY_DN71464_c0_g1_i1.p1 TRINITY_DN71464_c0_g1~~TRINITY_DN71464_c0_g1_i1.p1  ORF type:complete len:1201 (+),score=196.06 TRINITY_DN71464_c0_g1_i1:54-3656(+)
MAVVESSLLLDVSPVELVLLSFVAPDDIAADAKRCTPAWLEDALACDEFVCMSCTSDPERRVSLVIGASFLKTAQLPSEVEISRGWVSITVNAASLSGKPSITCFASLLEALQVAGLSAHIMSVPDSGQLLLPRDRLRSAVAVLVRAGHAVAPASQICAAPPADLICKNERCSNYAGVWRSSRNSVQQYPDGCFSAPLRLQAACGLYIDIRMPSNEHQLEEASFAGCLEVLDDRRGDAARHRLFDMQPPKGLAPNAELEFIGATNSNMVGACLTETVILPSNERYTETWSRIAAVNQKTVALELVGETSGRNTQRWGCWLFIGNHFARVVGPRCGHGLLGDTCCPSTTHLKRLTGRSFSDADLASHYEVIYGEVEAPGRLKIQKQALTSHEGACKYSVNVSASEQSSEILQRLGDGTVLRWRILEWGFDPFGAGLFEDRNDTSKPKREVNGKSKNNSIDDSSSEESTKKKKKDKAKLKEKRGKSRSGSHGRNGDVETSCEKQRKSRSKSLPSKAKKSEKKSKEKEVDKDKQSKKRKAKTLDSSDECESVSSKKAPDAKKKKGKKRRGTSEASEQVKYEKERDESQHRSKKTKAKDRDKSRGQSDERNGKANVDKKGKQDKVKDKEKDKERDKTKDHEKERAKDKYKDKNKEKDKDKKRKGKSAASSDGEAANSKEKNKQDKASRDKVKKRSCSDDSSAGSSRSPVAKTKKKEKKDKKDIKIGKEKTADSSDEEATRAKDTYKRDKGSKDKVRKRLRSTSRSVQGKEKKASKFSDSSTGRPPPPPPPSTPPPTMAASIPAEQVQQTNALEEGGAAAGGAGSRNPGGKITINIMKGPAASYMAQDDEPQQPSHKASAASQRSSKRESRAAASHVTHDEAATATKPGETPTRGGKKVEKEHRVLKPSAEDAAGGGNANPAEASTIAAARAAALATCAPGSANAASPAAAATAATAAVATPATLAAAAAAAAFATTPGMVMPQAMPMMMPTPGDPSAPHRLVYMQPPVLPGAPGAFPPMMPMQMPQPRPLVAAQPGAPLPPPPAGATAPVAAGSATAPAGDAAAAKAAVPGAASLVRPTTPAPAPAVAVPGAPAMLPSVTAPGFAAYGLPQPGMMPFPHAPMMGMPGMPSMPGMPGMATGMPTMLGMPGMQLPMQQPGGMPTPSPAPMPVMVPPPGAAATGTAPSAGPGTVSKAGPAGPPKAPS